MTQTPDFVAIHERFDKRLTPGQRAEIRRAAGPNDPVLVFSTGRLFKNLLGPWPSSYRVVWFLPIVAHKDSAERIGKQLADSSISEARMFQVLRAEPPLDLQHLRRLCRQAEPTVNWSDFGKTLWWWSEEAKRKIVEDYLWNKKEDGKK